MSNQEFLSSLLAEMKDDVRWPIKWEASLFLGDQLLCTGEAWLTKDDALMSEFVTKPGSDSEMFPMNGAFLKLNGRDERLQLLGLQRGSGLMRNRLRFFYKVVA